MRKVEHCSKRAKKYTGLLAVVGCVDSLAIIWLLYDFVGEQNEMF